MSRRRSAGTGAGARMRSALLPIAVSFLVSPPAIVGQTPADVRDRCVAAGGVADLCAATGVAVRALAGDVGLAVGLGTEVAGTASNLGERLGQAPRWSIGARAGLVRAAVPDLGGSSALGASRFNAWTIQAEVAAGLFDGFRLRPGVGGVLALDVLGRSGFVLLPGDEGFEGSVTAYTLGTRVGILRESFDLPGISVSASKRWIGDAVLSDGQGGPIRLRVDPSVTSLRATVGKDLFAWGLMAGFGWDDYAAEATFSVPETGGGVGQGDGRVDASRSLWFVGVSRGFDVVFSLALEAGIATGFDPVTGFAASDFDPTRTSFFASAGLRLTI